jgi:magnesium chelatase subunit H
MVRSLPAARRHVASPPRALSDPVDTESKAERFLREQLEREGVDVDAAVAREGPEEIVAALEDEARRLAEREASLTRDLDDAYRETFADLTVEVPTTPTEAEKSDAASVETTTVSLTFPEIDESSFRNLCVENPLAASALLDAAQKGDQKRWLAFQRNAHRAKLQRERVVTQRAAVEAEALVARRGGGAVAAAEAAARAKREKAKSLSARDSREGDLSITPGRDILRETAIRRIVLISGFESFNVKLYRRAARNLAKRCPGVDLCVFSDRDVESRREDVAAALDGAEVFFGSLLFDFDQVEWLKRAVEKIPTKFVFESALELMSETSVGSFEMKPSATGEKAGPPPAVKAVLGKFGSGKEEDKLVGYLSFLKIGPALLKFVPGRKAKDLRNWLTVYGYWNQGGLENVEEAFYLVATEYLPGALEGAAPETEPSGIAAKIKKAVERVIGGSSASASTEPKALKETPALGCYHPDLELKGFPWPQTVSEYLRWYDNREPEDSPFGVTRVPADAPTVAELL